MPLCLPGDVDVAVGGPAGDGDGGGGLPVVAQRQVTVALAIFKFDRFEWAVEKLTELGVARIVPFVAARSDAQQIGLSFVPDLVAVRPR